METMNRRAFLRRGAMVGGGIVALGPLHALGARTAMGAPPPRTAGYGPLVLKGDLWLPEDFEYAVISRQGQPMSDGNVTPGIFDGMAAYTGRRGTTILIRNHENRRRPGEIPVVVPADARYDQDPTYNAGNTKLVVDAGRRNRPPVVLSSFAVLGGTDTNCAGGITPWDSWVTCEEVVNRGATGLKHGYNFEIPASAEGPVKAVPIRAAGRFVHEASLFTGRYLYQTEDRRKTLTDPGALFYRYRPTGVGGGWEEDDDDDDDRRGRDRLRLADTTGTVEALKLKDEFAADMDLGREVGHSYGVEWVDIDEPDHEDDTDSTPAATRFQGAAKGAARFNRQEGMWEHRGRIYFDCTEGGEAALGQVWEYDPRRERLTLVYESQSPATLENPDNVVVVPTTGDIFLQEDSSGEQFVRGVTRGGEIYDFARTQTNETEFCGGCYDPGGRIFYLNQQGERGQTPEGPPDGQAVTYAIWGPFDRRRGDE
jgi:secreted PhoX family phosphatase